MSPSEPDSILRYRAELEAANEPLQTGRATDRLLGPGARRWLARYHDRLCRYLASSLKIRREWSDWRMIYTALHELLADVWRQHPRSRRKLAERRAWAAFRPLQHSMIGFFTLLPPGTELERFLPYYEGFVRFAAEDGAMSEFDAARVIRDLRRLFAERQPEAFMFVT